MNALRSKRVIVTGAGGMLGSAFVEALTTYGESVQVIGLPRADLDVTDLRGVLRCASLRPDVIVHCAGMALADECERHPEEASRVHLGGTQNIVRLALQTGARVVYPQSVFIFDGSELPVTEETSPAPRTVYATVKLAAERHVQRHLPDPLIVRMAGFFGGDACDKNFVGAFLGHVRAMLRGGESEVSVGERVWQPTYTLDHARNVLLLLARERVGVYHMGAIGEATFLEVARECVDALGIERRVHVTRRDSADVAATEVAFHPPRMVTANHRLDAEGLNIQRPWRVALRDYLQRPYFDDIRSSDSSESR